MQTLSQHVARLGFALTLCLGASGPVRAQELPEGLWIGRWVVSPRLSFGYEGDSNVFRRDSDNNPDEDAVSDRLFEYAGGLRASLPFRMSQLQFDYEATQYKYEESVFPRDVVQVAGVALNLNFATGDRLVLRDQYRRAFERAQELVDAEGELLVGPGQGELVFVGEPYEFNRWEVELARDIPDHKGYTFRIARIDFNYDTTDGTSGSSFFDYRGFDNSFEYRQPMAGHRSLILQYGMRRVDNFESNCSASVGDVYRKEVSDRLEAGFRGLLGEGMPYQFQIGWAQLDYEGDGVLRCRPPSTVGDSDKFEGVSGSASVVMRPGARLELALNAARRVLPSSFETYYVNNELRAEVEHDWKPTAKFGGGVDYYYSQYGDGGCGVEGLDRRDDRYVLNGFVTWQVHSLVQLEFKAAREARSSNCDFIDFDDLVVSTGVQLGWN